MTGSGRTGRRKKIHPQFVCERLNRLERLFRFAIRLEDWRTMNRPMESAHDAEEEKQRRDEYSKLLLGLNDSMLQGHCEPTVNDSLPASHYPDLILLWQYGEGILLAQDGKSKNRLISSVSQESVALQRSELARRLARHIVAAELQTTIEYLTKICRKWDPEPTRESTLLDS